MASENDKCIIDENAFNKLINGNKYINESISNKKKDVCSLSYLVEREMSQSECIKLGIAYEKVFCDLVVESSSYKNIKKKNKKGQKEKDHLFIDETNKCIYYAEFKGNINLDTEKSKATYEKCQTIVEQLIKEYDGFEVKWCLVNFRFLHSDEIPINIKKKYVEIEKNLFGVNQYLDMLNIKILFSETSHHKFINSITNKMFNNS